MPSKKILILTFYYTPDLCAGSFRCAAFVDALREASGEDVEIDILTTMPNRYKSFTSSASQFEQSGRITVRRFPIKGHKSGFVDQSISFGSYARQVLKQTRAQHYDLVFATSSRLMTAALGAWVTRRRSAPLYLDIRDIFTDTMNDVLAAPLRIPLLPFFRLLERATLKSATTINLVSRGFAYYFRRYTCDNPPRFYTNGIDPEFLDYDFRGGSAGSERKTILFAGNIGAGQGLEKIVPQAADLLADHYDIVVIGDGGTKPRLAQACRNKTNVKLLPPVDREQLKRHYANADILLMHLNDYDAFKKVLPSKIFEYAATGKPILAGVAGYAARFTTQHVDNAAVFVPCNAQSMADGLATLDLTPCDRSEFNHRFSRVNIMREMAADVLSFVHASD